MEKTQKERKCDKEGCNKLAIQGFGMKPNTKYYCQEHTDEELDFIQMSDYQ